MHSATSRRGSQPFTRMAPRRRAVLRPMLLAALVSACGGGGSTAEGNRAPVASGAAVLAIQDTALAVALVASDADGDALTYQVVTPPVHGSLTGTPPALSYAPASGFAGADAFTFTASDGQATSAAATVAVTVFPASGPAVPGGLAIDQRVIELLRLRGMEGGASLAIAKDGKLVLARGYGWADAPSRTPFAPDALSRIASISKTVTMAAVMHLVEGGQLGLDDKLLARLPAFATPAPLDHRTADITLRQVLGHAAGFPATGDYNPMQMQGAVMNDLHLTAPPTCAEVLRWWLGRYSLAYAPGTSHAYSSIGYCALSLVVEGVTGQGYQAYVRESVLAPMEIHDMRFAGTHWEDRAPGEVTYHSTGGAASVFPGDPAIVPYPYGTFSVPAYAGGGAWIASAVDLVRLLDGLEGRGRPPFLAPSSWSLALTNQWPGFGYGLGIDFWQAPGAGALWKGHSGWFGASPLVYALRSDDGWAFALILNSAPPAYDNVEALEEFGPVVFDAIAAGFTGSATDLYPDFPSPVLGPYEGR